MNALPEPYYQDDHATIYHGDCLDMIEALTFDVVVTDPPYGISHSSNKLGAPLRGKQIVGDSSTAARDAALDAAAADGFPAVCFGRWDLPPDRDLRGVLVWDKGGHVGMGDLAFPWKQNWEAVYIWGPGFKGRRGSGVLSINALPPWGGVITHPHEKPVDLMRTLIGKCPPGTILDPFMGSGTTLRAAKDLGRKSIGIELDERYCEIAATRLGQEVFDFGDV